MYRATENALINHLETMTPKPPTVTTNQSYEPSANTPYIKARFIPQTNDDETIDQRGYRLMKGEFLIKILVPVGSGVDGLQYIQDIVLDRFERGTLLTTADASVRLMKTKVNQDFSNGSWMVRPVSVLFQTIY